MSSDWHEGVLGDFIELKRGYDLPKNKRNPGHIPLVSSSGVSDFQSESMVKGPGVVTGRYGTIGQVFYIPGEFWPLNTTLYVRDFKGNDPKFISYFLKTLDFEAYSDKAAVPGINRNHIHEAKVLIPPLDVQKCISKVLGTIDDCISILRETNTTLESMAQALFKSWFVDFDPVRAKAEGRQPERMDAATAALFPDSFEDSALGLVPKGWGIFPFNETVSIIGGGTPKTSIPEYWDGDIPWFSVADAPSESDVFVIDTEKKISKIGLQNSSTKLLPVGTTIISARGTVGKLALVGREMAMNQSCYGLCGQLGEVYFTYFNTCRLVDSLKHHAHGAVFDTITRNTLASVSVALPPESIIFSFDESISPLMAQIKNNLKQIQTLTQLRDTLLPKLISGEIRLPEAESIISDAVSA